MKFYGLTLPTKKSVISNLITTYDRLFRKDLLIVWQGILTEYADDNYNTTIKTYVDLQEFTTASISTIVNWIRKRPKVPINICCVNFIEEHNFVKTVIMANIV